MSHLRPNTSWKFRRHPWSYGHGLILDFSNISMVVQFFATMRPCRPRKPSLHSIMGWASLVMCRMHSETAYNDVQTACCK